MFVRVIIVAIFSVAVTMAAETNTIKMSTTTSTENSGLLKYLLPEFFKDSNIKVHVIAVGSGKALQLAQNGDVDVVLSHAPKEEAALAECGIGINYRKVMYNDFIIAGPEKDFAGIRKEKSVVAAFSGIFSSQATFISRGDESGTHKKEKEIWSLCGTNPVGPWYLSIGQGMESCLFLADEKMGYTLTDRGTFLSVHNKIKLQVIFEGDTLLKNQYSIMAVNPGKHNHVNYDDAKAFIDWLVSEKGQNLIGSFLISGQQLFFPNASK